MLAIAGCVVLRHFCSVRAVSGFSGAHPLPRAPSLQLRSAKRLSSGPIYFYNRLNNIKSRRKPELLLREPGVTSQMRTHAPDTE